MTDMLETALSFGDEEAGKIVLRGHDLGALAERHDYEDVVAILWNGVVSAPISRPALGAARVAAFARLAPLEPTLRGRSNGQAMRMLMAAFDAPEPEASVAAIAWAGLSAVLAMRAAQGLPWLPPDAGRGHAADLLAIATGAVPDEAVARALDRYMILMIDHGISASTYAARIAASTGAGLAAVMLAALAVLEGPSHGGAPALVLDLLDTVAGPQDVPRAFAQARASGRRIMGFGSRAYRGEDVRAALMQREWRAIGGDTGHRAEATAIEAAFVAELARSVPGRALRVNVEYYAALLLEAVGVPRAGFTPMFAAARAAGWVAHAAEQHARGRMMRPASRYVGAPLEPAKPA